MYNRLIFKEIVDRLGASRQFIQILIGPRQVGKTTLAQQLSESLAMPSIYCSADEVTLQEASWLAEKWHLARLTARKTNHSQSVLLIIDEVQKIPHWAQIVKQYWDEDTRQKTPIKVLLLGSSALLIQSGLSESLAGRFEVTPIMHWSYAEMKNAFGISLTEYIFFGGYPGAITLINDEERWRRYILDSLIETTVARDILLMTQVNKPALLRRLFGLGCEYSGQILSYQKMIGQLQEAGNVTTLAHYLDLLAGAGLITGITKYAGQVVRRRGSSPKLQVMNTALMSATQTQSFSVLQHDPMSWGRWVESAVGAHLLNSIQGTSFQLFYWRERHLEVDFILQYGKEIIAIEVKSNQQKIAHDGMSAFAKQFNPAGQLIIGDKSGLSIAEFLCMTPSEILTCI